MTTLFRIQPSPTARIWILEWIQASERKKQGALPDAALKAMDLARFRDAYGNGVVPSLAAVRRIDDIIDGKAVTN